MRMNLTQLGILIIVAGIMILLIDFILPPAVQDTGGTGTPSTSVVATTTQAYPTDIAQDGMNVSNLMVLNVSYHNVTVSGLLRTLPPTRTPDYVVLHLGDSIGYGCYGYPYMMLEGININGSAVFLQTSASSGACPA